MASTGGRIRYLDGIRGLAALWVVLFHFASNGPPTGLLPRPLAVAAFSLGHLGVPVFFALSGYVICRSRLPVSTDGLAVRRFARSRLRRIVPPYYASIGVAIAAACIAAAITGDAFAPNGHPLTPQQLAAHLLFLQVLLGQPDVNEVYWSLCYEMAFYAAFIGLLWIGDAMGRDRPGRGRERDLVLGTALVVSLALAFVPLGLPPEAEPAMLLYSFLGGAAVCLAQAGRWPWWTVAGTMAVACLGALDRHDLFPLAVATTMALLACMDRLPAVERALRSPAVQFLGTISFSLFLVHLPVLAIVEAVLGPPTPTDGRATGISLAVSLVLTIAAAFAFWLVVERPTSEWSRNATVRGRDEDPRQIPQTR